MFRILDLPSDILQTIAEDYIGTDSRRNFLISCRTINRNAGSVSQIFKKIYPEQYAEIKNSIPIDKGEADKFIKAEFLYAHKKEYKQHRYNKKLAWEYPTEFERIQHLAILCKLGDLPALKNKNVKLFEIWHTNYPILFWANKHGHQNILDYYFSEFQKEPPTLGLHKIHLAILCFKNLEESLAPTEIQTQINLPANALGAINLFGPTPSELLSPLMLAAKINNMQAVVTLCNNTAISLNLTDTKGLTAIDHAIQQGNIEIAACLLNKGARLDPVKYFTIDNLFEELDDNSKHFLYQQPTMLIEAMKLKYKNGIASRFLKNADIAFKKEVEKWLSTPPEEKENLFGDLRYFFKHYTLGTSNWERGIYSLTQQIIRSEKTDLPKLIDKIISQIPDSNTVHEFKIALRGMLKNLNKEGASVSEHIKASLR